jgi:general secretion pathway protein B
MSFILDALRKSEHARQKQTGPAFAEVPVMAARPRTNGWATAAIALLVVNLVAVGVLLLRRAGDDDAAAPGPATASAPSTAPAVVAAPSAAPAADDRATAAALAASGSAGPTLAPPVAGTPAARVADSGRNPLAEEVGVDVPGVEPEMAASAASVPEGPPAVRRRADATVRRGSVVYAPIPEASDAPYTPPASSAPRATSPPGDALPSADDLTARGGLPELHLDLHVYSNVPQQRFIFVNSRKYREGDALQEGPVVEQITARGAVLSHRGSRFQLSND